MMLLPLGLKAKSRRIPVMTIAIFAITVAYSFRHFGDSTAEATAFYNSEEAKELLRARKQLVIASCDLVKIEEADCSFLKANLNLNAVEQPIQFMNKAHRTLAAHYGVTEKSKIEFLESFLFQDDFWRMPNVDLSGVGVYQTYLASLEKADATRSAWQAEHRTLSRGNISWDSLAEAALTHAGWLHLIGNMLFFLCLAIPVEERIGSIAFFVIYALAGVVGDLTQVKLGLSEWTPLLGASSNISGIAGLFLVLFWRNEMRIWVSAFFVSNRIVNMPTKIFIPVFIIAHDVIGATSNSSNIAHLAHLGGLGVGVVCALIWNKMRPVSENAVFPFEDELLEKAQKTKVAEERLGIVAQILFYHPGNRAALDVAMFSIFEKEVPPWENLDPRVNRFIRRFFGAVFSDRLMRDSADEFVDFTSALPTDWPLEKIVRNIDRVRMQKAIEVAENKERYEVAIRLLSVLSGLSKGKVRKNLETRIEENHMRLAQTNPLAQNTASVRDLQKTAIVSSGIHLDEETGVIKFGKAKAS
jgi:membrane associated rhomboid family serine protease